MLEECLKKRIIREFLKCYSNEKWNFVISNLIEIAILNLKVSFNTLFFTDDDFKSILDDLKHNYNENNKKNNYNDSFSNKDNFLYQKPSDDWRNGKNFNDYEIFCKKNENNKTNSNINSNNFNFNNYNNNFNKRKEYNEYLNDVDNLNRKNYFYRNKINQISADEETKQKIIEHKTKSKSREKN